VIFVTFPSNALERIKGRRPRGVLACKYFAFVLGKNKRVERVRVREREVCFGVKRERSCV